MGTDQCRREVLTALLRRSRLTPQHADRTAYLADHIAAVAAARAAGADVRGCFAWSLMDNFEWSYGDDKLFGIVRVDYDTQERTLKGSATWYGDTIASPGADERGGSGCRNLPRRTGAVVPALRRTRAVAPAPQRTRAVAPVTHPG